MVQFASYVSRCLFFSFKWPYSLSNNRDSDWRSAFLLFKESGFSDYPRKKTIAPFCHIVTFYSFMNNLNRLEKMTLNVSHNNEISLFQAFS